MKTRLRNRLQKLLASVLIDRGGPDERNQLFQLLDEILDSAESLAEIKAIHDLVEAVRAYVRISAVGLQEYNRVMEIKLCAQIKAGKLLRGMNLRGGDRVSENREETTVLQALRIGPRHSKYWQLMAGLPASEIRAYFRESHRAGTELTELGMVQRALQYREGRTGKRTKRSS